MITINHGFSALVCAGVASPLLRRVKSVSPKALGWAFFLGAMAPDADILSKIGGREAYFSGAWYAHREVSHSVVGTFILGCIVTGLILALRWQSRQKPVISAGSAIWLATAAWAGGLIHIFGDLFTPGMAMPVFWPLPAYYGGWSHIGWFSPYLFWLFIVALLLAWSIQWLGGRKPIWKGGCDWSRWLVFCLAGGRWVFFLVESRYHSSAQWVEYHRMLLPDFMVDPLQKGVRHAWFWLTG